MSIHYTDDAVTLWHGDCLDVMRQLPDASVDAVVTDPPYGLEFMGKEWDAPWQRGAGIGEHSAGFSKGAPAAKGVRGEIKSLPSYTGTTNPTCRTCGGTRNGNDRASRKRCSCEQGDFPNVTLPRMLAFQSWCTEWATEALRVLKPGGHLLAFGGTRTWHRLACAIEDAGFEVRDNVAYLHDGGLPGPMCWAFGSGFPKSHNVSKALQGKRCECDAIDWPYEAVPAENVRGVRPAVDADDALPSDAEPDLLEGLRQSVAVPVHDGPTGLEQVGPVDLSGLRQDVSPLTDEAPRGSSSDVLPPVSGSAVSGRAGSAVGHSVGGTEDEQAGLPRGQEPRMEGRRDVQAPEGELRGSTLRPMPAGVPGDGASGRLRDGAPSSDGAADRPDTPADRSGEPHQPRPEGQQAGEPGVVPEQRGSQAWGGWPVCRGCGKPSIPDGLGTALKPAFEPVVVARKPLVGTVAANVERYGTGALNIDGCRIGTNAGWSYPNGAGGNGFHGGVGREPDGSRTEPVSAQAGRWPANVILDESQAAELDRQSGVTTSQGGKHSGRAGTRDEVGSFGFDRQEIDRPTDTGGASRFFYTAKADSSERPRVDGVAHPTVKPLDLMRYLVRLVTPPGGVVLEPFAGSGTTLEACIVEGFRCIGIEREADYLPLILARITKPIEVTLL